MSRIKDVPAKPFSALVRDPEEGLPESDAAHERRLHGGVTLREATEVRAYQLWERAGRPEGDGIEFWLEAESELSKHH